MNIKPSKINLPNVSPHARHREPLREIGNFPRQSTPTNMPMDRKQTLATMYMNQPHRNYKLEHAPSVDKLDRERHIAAAIADRAERHSLRPSEKYLIQLPAESYCSNHTDKQAKFKVLSEEIELYYC
jgi:hypothetical protein